MREILFRGRRLDNGEWVEGAFCPKNCDMPFGPMVDKPAIIKLDDPYSGFWFDIDPSTIGQYIGRQDKNGKKIFEGHIVNHAGKLYVIEYIEKYSRFAPTRPEIVFAGFDLGACEIVGDIHDHPDLLQAVFPKHLQALSVQERQRVFLGKWGEGDTP